MRLRYARILYEETTNDLEAETALTKGVCVAPPIPRLSHMLMLV